MNEKPTIKKVCSFCVSDWHFITMIIPYIHNKIKNKENVEIFTQQSRLEEIQIFLSKLMLNLKEKEDIISLNWESSKISKSNNLEKRLEKCKDNKVTIIIEGNHSYIERVNRYIKKYIEKNITKDITIVNCYEVMQFNQNMEEILSKHDKILNTSGEKNIEDIFEGYVKNEEGA